MDTSIADTLTCRKQSLRLKNQSLGLKKRAAGLTEQSLGLEKLGNAPRKAGNVLATKKPIPKAHEWLNSAERFENQTLQPLLH